MNRLRVRLILFYAFLACAGYFLLYVQPSFSAYQNKVQLIQLNDDTINPVTAGYIVEAIDRAHRENAQCLIIKLDTPGGLLNSTRTIVKKMLTSQVPIVVYIAPNGSRAGSAGVFITYASHVAAMAPSTNIGAAHPVQMGGKAPRRTREWEGLKELLEEIRMQKKGEQKELDQKEDVGGEESKTVSEKLVVKEEELRDDENPMASKILQDTVAFIKAIAKERNRNVEWGVESVVKSASITSQEAMEKGVVEIIASSDEDLLNQLDGRSVVLGGKEVILQTKGAHIESIAMDARQKFFNVLANPNIAYFLMIFGFYGLLFEVTHPGFGVPGILGIVFLILAFYSMQTLPTNYAGLALFAVGIVLLVAEAYTPTFGILTLGGLTCMILGSMLLFESVDPIMRVSKMLIFTFSGVSVVLSGFLLRILVQSRKKHILSGSEGIIGEKGEAQTVISAKQKGKVFVHGERWNAISKEDIRKGEGIIVEEIDGLMLKVRKISNNKGD